MIVKWLFSVWWGLFWKQVRSYIFCCGLKIKPRSSRHTCAAILFPTAIVKTIQISQRELDIDRQRLQEPSTCDLSCGSFVFSNVTVAFFSKQMLWRKQYFGLLRSRHTASGNMFPHTCRPARANKTYTPSQLTSGIFCQNKNSAIQLLQCNGKIGIFEWRRDSDGILRKPC